MRYRFIIIAILIINFTGLYAATNPVKIRRICTTGNDNTLFWYPTTDTCSSFKYYIIWARNGTSGNFIQIDTVKNKLAETYTHVNANLGTGTKNWNYFIQNFDSCGPNFVTNSDTLFVDINNQDYPSFIDSVSVDINTNQVIIGWNQNKALDFAIYDTYINDGNNNYTPLPSTRDTFIIDHSSDPSYNSIEYDLKTKDSCGNTGILNINPHKTIFLNNQKDTCKKTCILSWTPYSSINKGVQIGWKKVLKYYIFKKINTNPWAIIDSVDGNVINYLDSLVLGQQVQYFIRAIKDTSILVTSSSNLNSFSTRFRTDPLNTELLNVSVNEITNNQIMVVFRKQTNDEWLSYNIFRSIDSISFLKIGNINNSGGSDSLFTFNDNVDASISKYYYSIHSNNLCDIDVMSTDISNSILLKTSGEDKQNSLSWNKYNYWRIGVEKYRIYRGIKQNSGVIVFDLLDSISTNETFYTDKLLPDKIDGKGICYYVQAIKNPGSIYPETSNSNHSCINGDLLVYIPNAFNPFGANIIFRPEGSFIDYKNSSMEIYDRWGGKVIVISDITNGWDGKDSQGQYSAQGVYLYKINIIGTNGTKQTKSGLVTLLN